MPGNQIAEIQSCEDQLLNAMLNSDVPQLDQLSLATVVRRKNHPKCPAGYVDLDQFWRDRGYEKREELVCRMSWKEINEETESEKPLAFWLKNF